jgi:hypothetical protein
MLYPVRLSGHGKLISLLLIIVINLLSSTTAFALHQGERIDDLRLSDITSMNVDGATATSSFENLSFSFDNLFLYSLLIVASIGVIVGLSDTIKTHYGNSANRSSKSLNEPSSSKNLDNEINEF